MIAIGLSLDLSFLGKEGFSIECESGSHGEANHMGVFLGDPPKTAGKTTKKHTPRLCRSGKSHEREVLTGRGMLYLVVLSHGVPRRRLAIPAFGHVVGCRPLRARLLNSLVRTQLLDPIYSNPFNGSPNNWSKSYIYIFIFILSCLAQLLPERKKPDRRSSKIPGLC